MTTNHVEKLDPALIRPGRVSKQIYMGKLRLAEALQMVAHYFCSTTEGGALTPEQIAAFTAVFPVCAVLLPCHMLAGPVACADACCVSSACLVAASLLRTL